MIDLVTMQAIYWDDATQGMKFERKPIPAELAAEAKEVARQDGRGRRRGERRADEQVPRVGELSVEEMKKGIRIRTINNEIVPMLCGSAFKNKGVQAMLDAVIDYLPSPVDVPPVKGENQKGEPELRKPGDDEPFAASRSRS